MSARLACPAAPGPLERFAVQFDPLFQTLAQRRGFRAYLCGLLLPRDRSKTLTALVGAEPVVQAPKPPRCSGCNCFCPRPPGTAKRSMPDAWRCSWMKRGRHLRPKACW